MSSKPDAETDDLRLSDFSDDIALSSGPRIDSSEEFPLPSFDFDEGVSADVLFPIDEETTVEEMPATSPEATATPEKSPGSKPPSQAPPAKEPPVEKSPVGKKDVTPPVSAPVEQPRFTSEPSIEVAFAPLEPVSVFGHSPFGSSEPAESLDADYFEAGLSKGDSFESRPSPSRKPPRGVAGRAARASTSVGAPPAAKVGGPQGGTSATSDKGIDEIFFEGPEPGAGKRDSSAAGLSREEWAEENPVDQYVRKVKSSRTEKTKPKVRMWVPAAGVAALVLCLVASRPILASIAEVPLAAPALVVASIPQGVVFAGGTSLGQAPLALTDEEAARTDLEIRKEGFLPVPIPAVDQASETGPVKKFQPSLQPAPVALAWDGIPEGSVIFWNGEKTTAAALASVQPGTYQLKVKPADRPTAIVKLAIEPRGSDAGPFPVGQAVQQEFAKQPSVSVGLALADPKLKADGLTLSVKSLDPKRPYTTKLKASSAAKTSVVLPASGQYKISFAGNDTYKAASQTVDLAKGASTDVSLKLAKQPPRPVARPQSQSPSYRPARPTYRPSYRPPSRPYSGGGGGSIAPPAF